MTGGGVKNQVSKTCSSWIRRAKKKIPWLMCLSWIRRAKKKIPWLMIGGGVRTTKEAEQRTRFRRWFDDGTMMTKGMFPISRAKNPTEKPTPRMTPISLNSFKPFHFGCCFSGVARYPWSWPFVSSVDWSGSFGCSRPFCWCSLFELSGCSGLLIAGGIAF